MTSSPLKLCTPSRGVHKPFAKFNFTQFNLKWFNGAAAFNMAMLGSAWCVPGLHKDCQNTAQFGFRLNSEPFASILWIVSSLGSDASKVSLSFPIILIIERVSLLI